jgi:Spermine/spermidine synthase domain
MHRKHFFLFLVIGIEGYLVLATELLAIRELIPFVGSGVEVVSIVISAILLPLAWGYYAGGQRVKLELQAARAHPRRWRAFSIRGMLLRNLLVVMGVLALGLSYPALQLFFKLLLILGAENRILQTALYSLVFLVAPAFLLAQTVPLISNYFSRAKLSEITGRMLFCSTAGSFLGSIVSTLLLMNVIGVHNTANVTITLLAILILVVSPHRRGPMIAAIACAVLMWCFNGNAFLRRLQVVADTPYSLIQIEKLPADQGTVMRVNRSASSKYTPNPAQRFKYVQYIENQFIHPPQEKGPRNILVLGAGGLTIGWDDRINRYTFVDIDRALQPTAEKYLLPSPLPPNKQVVVTSARAFLKHATEHYDLVIDDLFTNIMSIPVEAVTREFLLSAKNVLKPGGILIINIVSSPRLSDAFSVRMYNTIASVFPVFRQQVVEGFDGWSDDGYRNTLYIYYDGPLMQDKTIYTDDKNTYSLDH